VIPPQHYFVLGDNRNASFDSHEWGFLPAENLVGQAYKIYWPLERSQSLLR
jgi:signal peptidase I